ncbi:MAG: hypothetical protein K8H88_21465, partial [Sandaracinaceae bacterium]|nr:hypothetical protein [Sandaracinaceae bacterium]
AEPREAQDAILQPARGRPWVDRYVDALAMSWASTGIAVGALGALGMAFGAGIGCAVQSEIGCGAGLIGGGVLFAAAGWTLGPGIGTASVMGLNGMEGLAIWALGLTSNVAVFAVFTLVGTAVDETGQTWGLGRLWGMILGMTLGALAQVFLTPLYAVAIFEERPPAEAPELSLAPFLAPTEHGVTGGLLGAF